MWVVTAGDRLPVEEVEESVVEMYVRDVKKEYETVFVPFLKMCKSTRSTKVGFVLFRFINLDKLRDKL